PAPLLVIPPDVLLALAPRSPVRVGGGPVVQDSSIAGPCPAPIPLARARPTARYTIGSLVDTVGVHTGIDPAARGCRTVGQQLPVRRERPAGIRPGHVVTVDLGQHRFRVGCRPAALVVRA